MSTHNGMSYRAITRKQAEWIGMAASVAGGFVAVNGPRVERYTWADHNQLLEAMEDAGDTEGRWEHKRHEIQGGDLAYIESEDGRYLVLVVPAGGPLADEGWSIPSLLVEELHPLLADAGYAVPA